MAEAPTSTPAEESAVISSAAAGPWKKSKRDPRDGQGRHRKQHTYEPEQGTAGDGREEDDDRRDPDRLPLD
jgi:hypothetical protein